MTEEERKKAEKAAKKAAKKAKVKKHVGMAMACKKRITRLRIYYVTMAWLNVAALGSMFASLAILDAPVAFDEDPLIVQATFQPNADIPASNALFEALAAASTND